MISLSTGASVVARNHSEAAPNQRRADEHSTDTWGLSPNTQNAPGLGSNGEEQRERDGLCGERLRAIARLDSAQRLPGCRKVGATLATARCTDTTGYVLAVDSRQVPSPTLFSSHSHKCRAETEADEKRSDCDAAVVQVEAPEGPGSTANKPLMRRLKASECRGGLDSALQSHFKREMSVRIGPCSASCGVIGNVSHRPRATKMQVFWPQTKERSTYDAFGRCRFLMTARRWDRRAKPI